MKILPSIAAANQACLKEEIMKLGEDIVEALHVDIEDGNFVPNITFGLKTLVDLRGFTKLPFSIHLSVNNPEEYVESLGELGTEEILVHIETCNYPRRMINLIKEKGLRVGLALNPKTSIESLERYIDELDSILVMTSEPDGKGQRFIYRCLEKVRQLNCVRNRKFIIEVDGGIEERYFRDIWEAGADVMVLGRAIFNSQNPRETLLRLQEAVLNIEQHEK